MMSGEMAAAEVGALKEQLFRLMESRRSVRAYKKEKPSRAVIRDLIQAAQFAPCSCNLQLFDFIYVDDETLLRRLSRVATTKVDWAPACFVVTLDRSLGYGREAGIQSGAAAVENLILLAQAQGLGTCWMAGFSNDAQVKKILNIPRHLELMAMILVGWPDEEAVLKESSPRVRLPVEEMLHWNSYPAGKGPINTSRSLERWSWRDLWDYRRRIGPVYASRYGLTAYGKPVENPVLDRVMEHLSREGYDLGKSRCLDLLSYDGHACRRFLSRFPSMDLTVGDFLDLASRNLERDGCRFSEISIPHDPRQLNAVRVDEPFDIVFFLNRIEFTPDYDKLLAWARSVMSPGGVLCVLHTHYPTPYSVYLDFLRRLPGANVYERSPFYKMGPCRYQRDGQVDARLSRVGFKKVGEERICAGIPRNVNKPGMAFAFLRRFQNPLGLQFRLALYR